MENITVAQLNTKRWYRGLKVLYLVFVLFCYGLAVTSSIAASLDFYGDNKDYRQYIQNQSETNQQAEEPPEEVKEIRELKAEGYTTQQIADRYKVGGLVRLSRAGFRELYGIDSYNSFPSSPREAPPSMLWLFLIIPSSLFLAWLISQLPKWIFYYVMIGTMRPKE